MKRNDISCKLLICCLQRNFTSLEIEISMSLKIGTRWGLDNWAITSESLKNITIPTKTSYQSLENRSDLQMKLMLPVPSSIRTSITIGRNQKLINEKRKKKRQRFENKKKNGIVSLNSKGTRNHQ